MQLGFNENVIHNSVTYHIQTEDGGKKNPVITTLLFKEGIIIASRRTNYADIIRSDKLDVVVSDIMREQHGNMLKALKDGIFDKKEGEAESTLRPEEGVKEKKGASFIDEKSLDDIILEYLSLSEEE